MAASKKNNITPPVNRKQLIISISIIILILIPLFIWLQSLKKSPSPSPINITSTIKTNSYSLSYPTAWKEYESPGVNGGVVYYLQPPQAVPGVTPHVILQISNASQTNINRMNMTYLLLKYQKSTVTVNGTVAQKYNQILTGNTGPYHSIAYVFIAKGSLYLLELGYTQKSTDPQLENAFTQMVNNFTLY